MILAPVVRGRKGEYKKELAAFARQGFLGAHRWRTAVLG
jgi:excinuclease UvrABC ATPase subunit